MKFFVDYCSNHRLRICHIHCVYKTTATYLTMSDEGGVVQY